MEAELADTNGKANGMGPTKHGRFLHIHWDELESKEILIFDLYLVFRMILCW